jgi:putative membrane protein
MKKIITIIAVMLMWLFVSSAKAQTDTATMNFLVQASIGNLQEISSGKLAAQKATNPKVKAFGNRMVTDHGKAETQLLALANKKGYNLPANATSGVVEDPMLVKATDGKFDKLYVHMMVPGHRSAVGLFQRYAIAGKDPDIKAFAQQTLPVIKSHLAEIKAIDKEMK